MVWLLLNDCVVWVCAKVDEIISCHFTKKQEGGLLVDLPGFCYLTRRLFIIRRNIDQTDWKGSRRDWFALGGRDRVVAIYR